ncbi:MAG: TonB-dependent receptor [Gemmatales bacterium]
MSSAPIYDTSDYQLHQDTYYRLIGGTITGRQSTDFSQDQNSFSLYGQATAHLTPWLRLIGGLRYSQTNKDAIFTSRTVSGTALNAIGPTRTGSLDEDYLDPSVIVQVNLAPNIMFYATWARGSKSGGFVSNTYNVAAEGFQFRPERSTNYEAGLRMQFLDNRATVNLTVFRTDFDDLQQSAYDPDRRTFFTRNAASARAEGFEAELQLRPSSTLTFNASLAYLNARFLDYPGAPCLAYETLAQCNSADPVSIAAHNIAGLPLQFAPDWSGNVGFQHRLPIGSYRLESSANAQFRSDYYIADGYSPIWGLQDGWVKVDGRLAFGPQDDRWSIALIGRNIFDEHTRGSAIRFPASITGTARSISAMDEFRSVAVQATVRF